MLPIRREYGPVPLLCRTSGRFVPSKEPRLPIRAEFPVHDNPERVGVYLFPSRPFPYLYFIRALQAESTFHPDLFHKHTSVDCAVSALLRGRTPLFAVSCERPPTTQCEPAKRTGKAVCSMSSGLAYRGSSSFPAQMRACAGISSSSARTPQKAAILVRGIELQPLPRLGRRCFHRQKALFPFPFIRGSNDEESPI